MSRRKRLVIYGDRLRERERRGDRVGNRQTEVMRDSWTGRQRYRETERRTDMQWHSGADRPFCKLGHWPDLRCSLSCVLHCASPPLLLLGATLSLFLLLSLFFCAFYFALTRILCYVGELSHSTESERDKPREMGSLRERERGADTFLVTFAGAN